MITRLSLLLLLTLPVHAATRYVRQGAAGSDNGTDWINAYSDIPSTLFRGDTYYIADGNYGSWSGSTAESGDTLITIKKATASDHGTGTGWSSTYGDGSANFSCVDFTTGYWVFDGQFGGGPGNWEGPFGFVVDGPYGCNAPFNDTDNDVVTIAHTEFDGNDTGSGPESALDIDFQSDLTFRYCYIHHWNKYFFNIKYGCNNLMVEYCKMKYNWQDGDNHGTPVVAQSGTFNNWTFRYNFWEDCEGTYFFGSHDTASVSDYKIYGNIFYTTGSKQAFIGNGFVSGLGNGGTINGLRFFNNTISGVFDGTYGFNFLRGSDNQAYNNIWHRASGGEYSLGFNTATHDKNTFYNTTTNCPPGEENYSGNPFVNSSAGNFALVNGTDAGNNLGSPYNVDMYGNTRGADGNWDRGALELNGEGSAPVITSALTANGTNLTAFSYTIAAGGATSFGASGLPSGLTHNGGVISGTPTTGPSTNSITITATNAAGFDSETLVLTLYAGIAPTISAQPQAHTNSTATGVTLSVTAAGSATLLYRWQLANTNLTGATSASYSKVPAVTNDSGLYRCIVTNNFGSITSSAVYVSITNTTAAPDITSGNYSGNINVAVSYQIEATEVPDTFGAANLPAGLSLSGDTISGVPTMAQTNTVTLSATNQFGYDQKDVTFAIASLVGTNISLGSRVQVNIPPTLRVRDAAAISGNILGVQDYLALGTVTGGPTTADGYTWWEINYDTAPDGWSIEGSGEAYWLIVAPPPPAGVPEGITDLRVQNLHTQ